LAQGLRPRENISAHDIAGCNLRRPPADGVQSEHPLAAQNVQSSPEISISRSISSTRAREGLGCGTVDAGF
jgi:hypothetical protein